MSTHVVAYVEWIDAGVLGGAWAPRDEVLGDNLRDAHDPIRSAGLLIDETDEGIVIACSSNDTHDELGLAFWIPKGAIVRIERWTPGVDSPT